MRFIKECRRIVGVVAVAWLIAHAPIAGAAVTMSVSSSAPAVNPPDIAQLVGEVDLGGEQGHIWDNRPVQGQSFLTGDNPAGYLLNAVTFKSGSARAESGFFTIRVGGISGDVLTPLRIATAGNRALDYAEGHFITATFDTPVWLMPNQVYGVDWGSDGSGFRAISNWDADGVAYPDGAAYSSGSGSVPGATLTFHAADRVFHFGMTDSPAYVWNGGGSPSVDWSTGANWTGGVAPPSGPATDILIAGDVNVGTAGTPLNQNLGAPLVVNRLYVGGYTPEGNPTVNDVYLGGGAIEFAANGAGTSKLLVSRNQTVTIHNDIRGPGAVIHQGEGTLVLTGNNTYTGGTTIAGGALNFADGSVGNSGEIRFTGGTLQYAAGNTQDVSARLSVIAGHTATIDTHGNDVSFATPLAFGGGLAKVGAGVLTLSGESTYRGPTTVSGGTLSLANSQLYSDYGWGSQTITVQNGGILEVGGWADGDSLGLGRVGFAAANLQIDNGTIRYTGATSSGNSDRGFTIGAGGAVLEAEGTIPWTLNQGRNFGITSDQGGTLTLAGGSNGVLNLNLGGSGGLVKDGTGTWTLTGAHSFSGATTVDDGTLVVSNTLRNTSSITVNAGATLETGVSNMFLPNHATAMPDSRVITVDGGTWLMNANMSSRFGNVALHNGATWTSNRGNVSGWDALLADTTEGSATVTVSNTGGNTSPSTMDGTGILRLAGVQNFDVANVTGTPDADLIVSMVLAGPGNAGGAGGINKLGDGTMLLTGANTYNGGTTVSQGTLLVGHGSALGTGTVTLGGANTGASDVALYLDTNRTTVNNTITVSNLAQGNVTLGSRSTVTGSGANNQFNNIVLERDVIFDSHATDRTDYRNISGTGNVTVTGPARSIFATANSFEGDLLVSTSGSGALQLGANSSAFNAIPDTTNVTVAAGAVLNLSYTAGGSETIRSLNGEGFVGNNGGHSNILIVGANDGSGTFSGTIRNGGGTIGLTKIGAGTQVLSGANTYTGVTTVTGGTLVLAGNGQIDSNNTLAVGGNGTFRIQDSASATLSYLNIGNANGSAGHVVQAGGTIDYTGTGTADGSNFRIGHWPNQSSSYTLSGGTLNATGGDISIGWDGMGTFSQSGGTANVRGMRLARNNNTAGTKSYTMTGGTLNIGDRGIYAGSGTYAINLGGGTVGALAAWNSALHMNLTGTNGNVTFDTTGGNIGLSGVLSGSGGLRKEGAGTLTITNRGNTYSGGTVVDEGTLVLNGSNAQSSLIGSGELTINAGARVETHVNSFGHAPPKNDVVINGGTLHQVSADSHLRAVTMTGGTMSGSEFRLHNTITALPSANISQITAGTLRLYNSLTPQITFDVADGAAAIDLTVSSAIRDATPAAQSAGLRKTGAGTMVLTGSNDYTGGTVVEQGTLVLGAGGNVGAIRGTVTVNAGAALDYTTDNTFGWTAGSSVNELNIVGGTVGGADFRNHFWNSFQLNMTGGELKLGGDLNEFHNATMTVNSAPTMAVISGVTTSAVMRLRDGTSAVFDVADGPQPVDLRVDVPITHHTGTSGITKNGAGTMLLTGASTYTGNTSVSGGTLRVTGTGKLYMGGGGGNYNVTVSSGATLEIDDFGWDGSLGKLWYSSDNIVLDNGTLRYLGTTATGTNGRGFTIGAGGATLDAANAGQKWTLQHHPDSPSLTSTAGGLLTLTGAGDGEIGKVIPGGGGLLKTGSGTWTLTAANTYGGGTTVGAGTLLVNNASGSGTGSGAVDVNAGGTLGGNGTIGGNVSVLQGGVLAPGTSPGTLHVLGNLTFEPGAFFDVDILGSGDDSANLLMMDDGLLIPDEATIRVNLGFTPVLGESWIILDGAGDRNGEFSPEVALLGGYSLLPDGGAFAVGYGMSDGSHWVSLTLVPEPGAWLLLLSGMAWGLLVRGRRRRL